MYFTHINWTETLILPDNKKKLLEDLRDTYCKTKTDASYLKYFTLTITLNSFFFFRKSERNWRNDNYKQQQNMAKDRQSKNDMPPVSLKVQPKMINR